MKKIGKQTCFMLCSLRNCNLILPVGFIDLYCFHFKCINLFIDSARGQPGTLRIVVMPSVSYVVLRLVFNTLSVLLPDPKWWIYRHLSQGLDKF